MYSLAYTYVYIRERERGIGREYVDTTEYAIKSETL